MKKLLLAFLILMSLNLLSQTNDTIILKTGKIIPCQVEHISNNGTVTYFFVDSDGDSVLSMTGKALIKEIRSTDSLITLIKKKYTTWISSYKTPYQFHGVIYEIQDSAVSIAIPTLAYDFSKKSYGLINIPVNNLERIKVRRDYQAGWGALIGAVAGFAIGYMVGENDNFFPGWVYGVSLGVPGAIIGGAIGSVKIKIPINGSMDNFNREKNRLKKYSQQ